MLKNAAVTWFLASVVSWSGLAAAEPPASKPAPTVAVEAPAAEGLERGVPVAGQEELRGVVIEEIPKGSTLEKAGLLVGDVITAWKRLPNPPANPEAAEGAIASYFDWQELEVEQAPRGTVVLRGRRVAESLELTATPGIWDAKVRPVLAPALDEIYERGKAQLAAGDLRAAVLQWESLAHGSGERATGDFRVWVALRVGRAYGKERAWGKAVEVEHGAVEAAVRPAAQVAVWEALGEAHERQGEFAAAETAYSSALAIRQARHPENLGASSSLTKLGALAWAQGQPGLAQQYFLKALRIQEQLAPESLERASSLNNLGAVTQAYGELDRAQDFHSQAVLIQERLSPMSLDLATSFNNLGAVCRIRGDLERAYDYLLRAMYIRETLAPQSLAIANSLNNLGAVSGARGELERSYAYYLRALKIREQLAPQSLDLATSLNNLGIVSGSRGDLEGEYEYHLRALEIEERLAPRSLALATSLDNLGSAARSKGDLERARDYHERALQLSEDLAPNSLMVASSLNNLGNVARTRKEFDRAQKYYSRALQIREQLAPQSLNVAVSLSNLGILARDRDDLTQARSYYFRALEVLEHQVSHLGGSYNIQAGFRSKRRGYYLSLLDLQLTQSRFSEAFQVLERFRAQTFLTMLTERDVAFTADIPEELDRERRRIGVLYDRTQKKLTGLNPRDHAGEIEATRKELQKLDDEAGDVEARIRSASPKLAALRYPQPLDIAAAQQALDPGTLLLSFSVGKEKTALFVLSHLGDLEVKTLPFGEEALRTRVKQLLSLIREADQGSSVGELRQRHIEAVSRELYNSLLGPVVDRIAASERLLILPDGPLHALPFAALVRDTKDGPQTLAAWKPLHVALSATVYAELKQRRHPAGEQDAQAPLQLAAFGDPVYPQSFAALKNASTDVLTSGGTGRGDPAVRGAAERGLFDFQPLPYTRREVLGIASLFPEGTARTFLGPDALEERIKSLDPKTRILHLAAHGSTDEHLPSGSFIALTIPEETPSGDSGPQRDNGLLQVWEIFERVRLNADLVVLSACDSGLGEELGGEGLIGLTRAFQYAGARSVLASLWNVNDLATSELMIRFYKHLRAGLPKDQALQAAQQELIRGPVEIVNEKGERERRDFSAPYYWAGFQLYGDWQ